MNDLLKMILKVIETVEKREIDLSSRDSDYKMLDSVYEYFPHITVISNNLHFWTGTHFEKLADRQQEKSFFLKRFLKKLLGRKHVSKNIISTVYSELLNEYHLPKELEAYISFINLKNGVLAFTEEATVELLSHSPDYGLRYMIPYNYDRKAKAPLFEKFIKETVEDDNSIKFLYEYMGYILISRYMRTEVALFLLGEGRNGKSVLIDILTKLVGQANTAHVELQDLGNPNRVVLMDGKLLNVGSDSSDKNFDPSQFKRVVSREPITARQLYKDAYVMTDIPVTVFAMNNLPFSQGDTSFGLLRRLKIVKFNKIIEEEKVDRDLPKKLEAELPGILNLAIEGAIRLIKQNGKFTESEAINQEVKSYEDDINMVKRFIDDLEIEHDSEQRISNQQIYSIFTQWCKDEGIKAPTKRYLIRKMKSSGFDTYKNNAIRGFKITTSQTVIIDDVVKDADYFKNNPHEIKPDRKI